LKLRMATIYHNSEYKRLSLHLRAAAPQDKKPTPRKIYLREDQRA